MRDENPFDVFAEDVSLAVDALRDAWIMHSGDCEPAIIDFRDAMLTALRHLREAGGNA